MRTWTNSKETTNSNWMICRDNSETGITTTDNTARKILTSISKSISFAKVWRFWKWNMLNLDRLMLLLLIISTRRNLGRRNLCPLLRNWRNRNVRWRARSMFSLISRLKSQGLWIPKIFSSKMQRAMKGHFTINWQGWPRISAGWSSTSQLWRKDSSQPTTETNKSSNNSKAQNSNCLRRTTQWCCKKSRNRSCEGTCRCNKAGSCAGRSKSKS